MGKHGKTHIPASFKHLFEAPKMGGNKSSAGQAWKKGNAAPKGFKPAGLGKK